MKITNTHVAIQNHIYKWGLYPNCMKFDCVSFVTQN